jgi:electron transfer flavoprotein alpha subunit
MAVLLIADHDDASLTDTTLKTLTAARAISPDVDVLVLGEKAQAAADAAARADGVRKVLLAESPALGKMLAEAVAEVVVPLMQGYEALVTPSTSAGKNVSPRIAAKLDASQVSDVVQVVDPRTFVRPIYAGNALETVTTAEPKLVVTVRPTAFKAAAAQGGSAAVERIAAPSAPAGSRFVSEAVTASDRPELGAAKVVISGGRALGSAEEFKAVLEPLADRLGAAIGASRAAVDAGYAPNDYQVGQTGKIVAPQVYVAIGISGAIQHLAGMKDSKTIVAINKDEEAPIFQVADIGLVGDLFKIVPELTEKL